MNRTEKEQAVEKLARTFQDSQGVILVDFKGVSVPEITELRDKVRETGGHYEVVKNRLAKLAATDTPLAELTDLFVGPTAIAYTESDSVGLAKALREFVRGHDGMEFKAGFLEGRQLSVDEVEQLAKLPSRDELLSKVLFLVQAPLTQFATALKSPLRDLAWVLSQLAGHEGRLAALEPEAAEEPADEPAEEGGGQEAAAEAEAEQPAAGEAAEEVEVEVEAAEAPAEQTEADTASAEEAEAAEESAEEPAAQEAAEASESVEAEEGAQDDESAQAAEDEDQKEE